MNQILKGIMRYRGTTREQMVQEFKKVKDNPHPKAVFFTCMDSRMIPTRYTDTHVGDMFVIRNAVVSLLDWNWVVYIRNAGNLCPHAHHFQDEYFSCEPAGLELGCVVNSIRHVIVCGHSDCKAMNLLYQLRDPNEGTLDKRRISPLKAWLLEHASSSLDIFKNCELKGFDKPVIFSSESPLRRFIAYIDHENRFSIEDKLSQINTLQQLSNIASYGFLKQRLKTHDLHLHALWFDIYTGDIFYFSRGAKRFIEINEQTIDKLLDEVDRWYS
uniref:Carbonic anhydrase n=1 Tax=Culicoides sonorensis TaxID=179676 RepID=A0A336LUC9_CULSO